MRDAKDCLCLAVDDDPISRQLIEAACDLLGARWESTASGNDAINRIKRRHFDLVVLDHALDGLTGVHLLTYIGERLPVTTQVIVLSGQVDRLDIRSYERLSVIDVLKKPVSLDRLAFCLRRALGV